MRIRRAHSSNDEGGTLVVALMTCVILGILIGSYLSLIQNQQLSVARAQAWNSSLVVAEAGIEEAMAHLNSGIRTNDLAANSWTDLGGGIYEKTNFLGDSYSVVDIKVPPAIVGPNPVVVATAFVPGPLSRPKLTRTVTVTTKPKSLAGLALGMVARKSINLKGSGDTMDSFDSSNTNYSTLGVYDPKKAKDGAQATALSSAAGAVDVDNGSIKGYAHTAPGGTVTVGSGSVGDATWTSGKKAGLQPGHSADDATYTVSDVSLPAGVNFVNAPAGRFKVNGVNYKYALNNAAAWRIPNLTDSVYVNSPGVILYVDKSMKMGSGTQIMIAPGASLTLYVGAPDASIGGQGVMNPGGRAQDFVYKGLPSNTSLALGANAAFTGYIDAPEADFTLGGGGSDFYDFVGACVVNSVVMNGHFHFHFDESLAGVPTATGYVVISWDDL